MESPYLRFAPGLSLKYQQQFPERELLIKDADALTVLYDLSDPEALEFVRYTHAYAAYVLLAEPQKAEVLIVQQGGGLALPAAVSSSVKKIFLLVDHPGISEAAVRKYGSNRLVVGSSPARSYLAGSRARYHLIQVEHWGPSLAGTASLSQEHLLTVEAIEDYLEHLHEGGLLSLSRKIHLPPADSLRLFAAVFKALQQRGAARPEDHIIVIRNWESYTLLVSSDPFEEASLTKMKVFCRQMNFDLVFFSGLTADLANRFNIFDQAFFYQAVNDLNLALQSGREKVFFRRQLVDVRPATDDRPFQNRFTKWLRLPELYRSKGSRFYLLLLSGEVVVAAVFLVALLVAGLLLIFPLRLLKTRLPASSVLYFLLTGAGFMLAEMGFIQAYNLLFGEPVVAFTLILGSMLIFSGIGGAISAHWNTKKLTISLLVLLAVLGSILFFLKPLLELLLSLPNPWQIVLAVLLVAPPACLLGVPFPVGIRLLLRQAETRAYGWALNGMASVLFSILALAAAMAWGISRVLLAALICYSLLFALLLLTRKAYRRL